MNSGARPPTVVALFTVLLCVVLPSSHTTGAPCISESSVVSTDDGITSLCYSLPYSGSSSPPGCSARSCLFERTTYFDSYACSGGPGGNTITQVFANPLPDDVQLLAFSVVLWGRFQCDAAGPQTVGVLTFNDDFYAAGQINTATIGCSCPNCATSFVVPTGSPTGVPNIYNYGPGANNTMTIRVLEGALCLSAVDLHMTYSAAPPDVFAVVPQSTTLRSTNVTVTGRKFTDTDQALCSFAGVVTQGTFVSQEMMVCPTPDNLSGQVAVSVSENNLTWSGQLSFYFATPYNLTKVKNLKGPSIGGTPVMFIGQNFKDSDLQYLVCRFGSIDVPAYFSNETFVQCLSPEMTNISDHLSEQFRVQLYLSQNGLDFFFTNHFFTYVSKSPNKFLFVPWEWVVFGLACLLLLAFVVVGALALRWFVNRRRPSARNKLAGSGSGSSSSSSPSEPLLSKDLYANSYSSGLAVTLPTTFNNIDLATIDNMKLIEKGSFGLIYKGDWEGTTVAIKKLPAGKMSAAFIEELEHEAAIMRQLRHPNILNFIGTSCDLEGRQICIVMEYMDRGSLYRMIHDEQVHFSLQQMRAICIDAARGVNYLHHLNPPIIHRDLKSHNLLLNSDGVVKVCDFGLSRFIESTLAGTMTACGTPSWTAPEVLRNERYTFTVDVYSFGIVVWELFSRQDPYPGMPPFQIVFAVGSQFARPLINSQWPQAWVKLMTTCWAEDPEQRPTFDEILHWLQHDLAKS